MWRDYAKNDGVCIITTTRQLFIQSRLKGGRIYKVHYLDENNNLGSTEIPFYFPHEDERVELGLPVSERVFHAIKKHEFKEENEIRSIIYKKVQEKGLLVPFNFGENVSRIVLNPYSTDAQKNAIMALAEKYAYTNIVEE